MIATPARPGAVASAKIVSLTRPKLSESDAIFQVMRNFVRTNTDFGGAWMTPHVFSGRGFEFGGKPFRPRKSGQNFRCLIQVKVSCAARLHTYRMDEAHIQKMIEVMVACHGAEAESAARKRANRCLRRKEPEWAALWREVAERLAQSNAKTTEPEAKS